MLAMNGELLNLINYTVQKAVDNSVSELKRQNLIVEGKQSPFQKTETLLFNYNNFKAVIKDKETGLVQYTAKSNSIYNSTVWFNLILLEGFIDLFPYDPQCQTYIETFQTSLDYGYENHLNTTTKLMPRDLLKGWDTKATKPGDANVKPDATKDVMDQAALAEIYAQLAEFYAYLAKQ